MRVVGICFPEFQGDVPAGCELRPRAVVVANVVEDVADLHVGGRPDPVGGARPCALGDLFQTVRGHAQQTLAQRAHGGGAAQLVLNLVDQLLVGRLGQAALALGLCGTGPRRPFGDAGGGRLLTRFLLRGAGVRRPVVRLLRFHRQPAVVVGAAPQHQEQGGRADRDQRGDHRPPPRRLPRALPRPGRPRQHELAVQVPPQVVRQRLRRRVPPPRIFMETFQTDVFQMRGARGNSRRTDTGSSCTTCNSTSIGRGPTNGGRPVSRW